MNRMKKIALGTAQFGLNYGINNYRGKIPKDEIFEILHMANENGIIILDTASAYGNSESIIGDFLERTGIIFSIVSKLPKCKLEDARSIFDNTLKSLRCKSLYGYMIHDFSSYNEERSIWDFLCSLKNEQRIEKVGFSLYFPWQLQLLIEHGVMMDIVQVPYNVFDRRFEDYFGLLKEMGVEIHVRSVFLQGLFFKEIGKLEKHFDIIKDKLKTLQRVADDSGLPIVALCMNFVADNKNVDKIVVGVDSVKNLKEIIEFSCGHFLSRNHLQKLLELKEANEDILLPFRWQLN